MWKLISFSLVATLLGLGVLEAVARVFVAPYVAPPAMPFDRRLLWKMKPGVRHESGVAVSINALGLRGPALEESRAEGVRRILTLGDSTVFGFAVSQDQVFSSVLADHLNASADRPASVAYEAVNGGMVGYSSLQSLHLLEDNGEIIRPSLVIVANIWSDNNFDTFVDRELLEQQRLSSAAWQADSRSALRNSRLFVGLERWLSGDGTRKVGWMQQGHSPTQSLANTLASFGDRQRRRVPIEEYVQHLEAMVAWSEQHHSEVIFLMLPHLTDAQGLSESLFFWHPYREAMRAVARHKGVPLIEMPGVVAKRTAQASLLFIDDLHPSSHGHALIANTIANWLQSVGWVKEPERSLRSQPQAMEAVSDPFETEGRATAEGPEGPERFLRALGGTRPGEGQPRAAGAEGKAPPPQDSLRNNLWATMPVQPPAPPGELPGSGFREGTGTVASPGSPGQAGTQAGAQVGTQAGAQVSSNVSANQTTKAGSNGAEPSQAPASEVGPVSHPYTGKPPTLSRPFMSSSPHP